MDGGSEHVKDSACTWDNSQILNKRTEKSMPSVGFEPAIPVFERPKIFHALDRLASVIGSKGIRPIDWNCWVTVKNE